MLGQTSSEKTADVVGARGAGAPASDGGPPSGASGQDAPVADEPPSGESKDAPANDAGDTTKSGEKPRRKGHGRVPGSGYAAESIAVPHPTLCTG